QTQTQTHTHTHTHYKVDILAPYYVIPYVQICVYFHDTNQLRILLKTNYKLCQIVCEIMCVLLCVYICSKYLFLCAYQQMCMCVCVSVRVCVCVCVWGCSCVCCCLS